MCALAIMNHSSRFLMMCECQVTASHNGEPDNGIKMVDASGGMLAQSWEGRAQALANAAPADAAAVLADACDAAAAELRAELGAELGSSGSFLALPCVVLVGMDTRSHSPKLAELAKRGAALAGAMVRGALLSLRVASHAVLPTEHYRKPLSSAPRPPGAVAVRVSRWWTSAW